MHRACSVATIRRAEATAGVAEPVLMQRAATALSGVCADLLRSRNGRVRGRVVGLVGSGNNGGDALWALALLARRGVATWAIGNRWTMHAEGAAAARAAGVRMCGWDDPALPDLLARADLALDGIVGIGGAGALRPPAAQAVAVLDRAGVPVVAVDVPSGVDSDTGQVAGAAVHALVTVCFGVLKPGLLVAPGRGHAGTVTVADIGLRPQDLEPTAVVLTLSDLAVLPPEPDTHKYRRGVVGVVAGSGDYPGAAVLAVGGARRSGAGMVVFRPGSGGSGVADPVAAQVLASAPDVVLSADRPVDARCVGPGLGSGPGATELVLAALADEAPLVVDASALAVLATLAGRDGLAERRAAGRLTVLTPHAGEFARLGLDPSGGPLVAARRAATDLGAIVVLKGPGTVVAPPAGPTLVDGFGTSALACAGSGDVLAGLMAGMLAAGSRSGGLDDDGAARTVGRAVALHGLAGRLAAAAGGPVTAADVLAALPQAHAVASGALA